MGVSAFCMAVERDCEVAVRVSRERPRAYGIAVVGYGVADVCGSEAVAGVCLYIPSDLDAVARKMKHVILRPCKIEAWQHEFVRQHALRGENPSLMFNEYGVVPAQPAFLKHEASRRGTEFSGGEFSRREFLVFRVEQSRGQPDSFSGEPVAVVAAVEYSLEIYGFSGVERAAVGEQHAVKPVVGGFSLGDCFVGRVIPVGAYPKFP